MLLINPPSNNPMPHRALEPPIWCAMLAQKGDRIVDLEFEQSVTINKGEDVLIVVMGNNPSVSSTPKMPSAEQMRRELESINPLNFKVFITGLHPQATGVATYQIPPPGELAKIKRARWELLDMSKYRAHNWHCLHDLNSRSNYASLYTSFGCPFNCDFCNIPNFYGTHRVYYRKPQDVIDEIDLLVRKYNIRNLKICDELFTLNYNHVAAICAGIRDYGLNIWAYAKVGTVTPDMVRIMKEAGINWLAYGFESGNPEIMKGINKRYGDVYKTVQMTRDAGINIIGNFLFGLPNDTETTMMETFALAQEMNCEWVNFYCAMAYPGSKIYDGLNKDWASYNQYNNPAVPPKILEFKNWAFKQYFSYPPYLDMIKSKFGQVAVDHIRTML